jgi:23S rRNA (cytidine1920-2'-O)/16S rRNA (cytidine1409-2'-O)-methyltransferase
VEIIVDEDARVWVSRGGLKLDHALDVFQVEVQNRTAIDVGASTGGFTEVMLDRGARRVLALDVGHDQLDPSLRSHPLVESYERLNIRDASPADLGAPFDLIVADVSFISLTVVAGSLAGLGGPASDWIVLVKPQFEVGRGNLDKSGVVTDAGLRATALVRVVESFRETGLTAIGCVPSPVRGGSGNREALLWLRRTGTAIAAADLYKVLADD